MTEKMYNRDEFTTAVRGAIEDRAKWLFLFWKYAKDKGMEFDEVAQKAINAFGEMKGKAVKKADNAQDFALAIFSGPAKEAFEMEAVKLEEKESIIKFKYCALVEAWKKLGASPEEIANLCRLARFGDYGMVSCFPELKLEFKQLLSEGQDCCEMVISVRGK